MATIYEVSTLAGVSLATVSRVMNNNTNVSEKTRQKVLHAMKELGYKPNTIAQSLASSRTNSVGILMSELNGAFFGDMMQGIETTLRNAGKHVIITTGYSIADKEKDALDFLNSRKCDAIIAHIEAIPDEELIEICEQQSTPIFLIGRYVEALKDKCISLDNELGGYIATKHLLDAGHQQIAYVAGPLFKADSQQRLEGHKRALAEATQCFNDAAFYEGNFKETGGYNALKHFLETNQLTLSGVVCANDEMASGALAYAHEKGIKVPEQLSIIGFDDINFSRYTFPKLTTVNYPIDEMGNMAANLVLRTVYQHKSNVVDIQHVFQPTLVERDSITSPQ